MAILLNNAYSFKFAMTHVLFARSAVPSGPCVAARSRLRERIAMGCRIREIGARTGHRGVRSALVRSATRPPCGESAYNGASFARSGSTERAGGRRHHHHRAASSCAAALQGAMARPRPCPPALVRHPRARACAGGSSSPPWQARDPARTGLHPGATLRFAADPQGLSNLARAHPPPAAPCRRSRTAGLVDAPPYTCGKEGGRRRWRAVRRRAISGFLRKWGWSGGLDQPRRVWPGRMGGRGGGGGGGGVLALRSPPAPGWACVRGQVGCVAMRGLTAIAQRV